MWQRGSRKDQNWEKRETCYASVNCVRSLLLLSISLPPSLLSGYSDLDRDFWNNNDSSNVQQRWSSYPPKEFLLNMSPYAPYGDPRLTPKWVSVPAGRALLLTSEVDAHFCKTASSPRGCSWHHKTHRLYYVHHKKVTLTVNVIKDYIYISIVCI